MFQLQQEITLLSFPSPVEKSNVVFNLVAEHWTSSVPSTMIDEGVWDIAPTLLYRYFC